jgi:hypothetical protein
LAVYRRRGCVERFWDLPWPIPAIQQLGCAVQAVGAYRGIGQWAADPFNHPTSYAFPALFATFLFITYLMLYALTHLQEVKPMNVAKAA